MPNESTASAMTVDVEDYFQVSAFERHIPRSTWDQYESRVVSNTHRVLRLLERHHVRATFFVLGWVARHYPRLVRDIQRAGHEIGSHGYWHRLIYEQTPEQFRADVRQSRLVIEDITGEPVTCYRAPSFSITRDCEWAFEILSDEGFLIDSSVFPVRHHRYGIPDAQRIIHTIHTSRGTIVEFPPSVLRLGRLSIPVAGGGYFRLYPFRLTLVALRRVHRALAHPLMFYVHPWELDPDQPRLAAGSRLDRARHYVNLARTERRLDQLLRAFPFAPVSDVVRSRLPLAPPSRRLSQDASAVANS
jgi:polysaccharide deacetylase family protein (PEP-CTERM system associated)